MKPVKGGPAVEAEAGMVGRGSSMNSGDMALAADPAKAATVFDTLVRALLEEVRRSGNNADADTLTNSDWGPAKTQFLAGVSAGLDALGKKMVQMSARSTQLTTQSGADPFLDPRAFRVRDMYGKLLKIHDEPTTMKLLEKYAELLQNGGSDEDFWAWHDLLYPPRTAPTLPEQPQPAAADLVKPKRGFAAIRTPIGGRAKPRIAPAKVAASQPAAPRRPITPIRSDGTRAKPRTVGQ
jgi:hypothetical protein